jgi:hypothetical protein
LSQLRATLPVSIFISPNLPIDDNNNLVDQSPQTAQRAVASLAHQAPPLYGEHQFDQLYSELDSNGYRTPGTLSGRSTPATSHSGSTSTENIASMNTASNEALCPSALHTRLTNLYVSGSSPATPPSEPLEVTAEPGELRPRSYTIADYCPPIIISTAEDPITPETSRRGSEEGQVSPGIGAHNQPYGDVGDLCRVPSYSTAVRSTTRTRYTGDLPDYQAATAGDASVTAPVPRSPQQAHFRGDSRTFPVSELTNRPYHLLHNRGHGNGHGHDQDSARRLWLLHARARG